MTRPDSGPFGAAALMAPTYLPGAVLSPFAGVLVDRARLRRLTVTLTSLQVVVVGSVPVAGALGRLGWWQLYAVATVSGALTFPLSVALQAALIGTVPGGALAGGAPASWLGDVPVLTGAAAEELLAACSLWLPPRLKDAVEAPVRTHHR
ncbi:hypothetical protein QMK19_26400 [Streptomyces sp. H10-C2]|uniref:hypothetical protein n=1 Tax=unclassified Streptomyces TaxID=2593676 RepID=UPI0024BABF4E|nr:MULTISPECIES: hypothetical protein [unclassified Streptomyces]MDJ0344146.1 hypothetical protein [Streptomyces sp. PH10-H1]MDJ0373095.1 hypothetical protein [Streptomyces sp. H10-C2]